VGTPWQWLISVVLLVAVLGLSVGAVWSHFSGARTPKPAATSSLSPAGKPIPPDLPVAGERRSATSTGPSSARIMGFLHTFLVVLSLVLAVGGFSVYEAAGAPFDTWQATPRFMARLGAGLLYLLVLGVLMFGVAVPLLDAIVGAVLGHPVSYRTTSRNKGSIGPANPYNAGQTDFLLLMLGIWMVYGLIQKSIKRSGPSADATRRPSLHVPLKSRRRKR
jgi:hypothetical protein